MRNYEWRSKNLKPECPCCRLLQAGCSECSRAGCPQRAVYQIQHFDQIRSGTAAGIKNNNALVGKAPADAELGPQYLVDTFHHVPNDLARRVPDPEFLSQIGIKLLKEWLIEVLDSVSML